MVLINNWFCFVFSLQTLTVLLIILQSTTQITCLVFFKCPITYREKLGLLTVRRLKKKCSYGYFK
jgi:hypothetical protein